VDDGAARLALRLYESAISDEGWEESLRDLARGFGADMALLQVADIDTDRPVSQNALATHNVGADVVAEYAREHVGHDPWINEVFTRLGPGRVAVLNDYAPVEAWAHLPRWRHFMNEGFPARHGLGAFFDSGGQDGLTGVVSVFRTGPAGAFAAGAAAALQAVLPHIQRAASVHARLHGPGLVLAHATEALGQAVAVLGHDGRPQGMNPEFAGLLRDGWFRQDRLGLAPADQAAAGRFAALVAGAARLAMAATAGRSAGEVVLRHPRSQALLLARVLPQARPRPAALVIIHDPARARPPASATLRDAFGLTAAESQLALALLAGETVADYAARRRVAQPTVRTQLAALFAKTGTTRQAALVRRLAALGG
jgi:DNA-binding CsgD family transcriptional regulator